MPRLKIFQASYNTALTLCPCDDPRSCTCCPALPALEKLYLYGCDLGVSVSRLLAQCLSRCPRLKNVDLSCNALHGPLPDAEHTIACGATLTRLNLSENRIEGPLTAGFLSHFSILETLSLDKNRLTGTPPPRASYPVTIRNVFLSQNMFTSNAAMP